MSVKAAFREDVVTLKVADITPIKVMEPRYRKSETYRRIAASLEHVGIIEPLVVYPKKDGKYLLLEGHTRLDILINTKVPTVKCLIATENESYTYNKRVNYIPPIAQHHMILRALAHVSEQRIASALDVTVASIREKRDLLKDICPEASDLLRNERVTTAAFGAMRKMKSVRQIEVARLMMNAHKFSGRFAHALLMGTREELLTAVKPQQKKATPAQQSMMEQETDELLRNMEGIRENYGNQVLNLTTACRYIERLIVNARVRRFLERRHQDTLVALDQLLVEIAADKQRRPPPSRKSPARSKLAVAH